MQRDYRSSVLPSSEQAAFRKKYTYCVTEYIFLGPFSELTVAKPHYFLSFHSNVQMKFGDGQVVYMNIFVQHVYPRRLGTMLKTAVRVSHNNKAAGHKGKTMRAQISQTLLIADRKHRVEG